MPPHPKPEPRRRDPDLLRLLHLEGGCCVLCGASGPLNLHHVLRRSQGGDDVRANLIPFLCGSGNSGCHGDVEDRNPYALMALGDHIARERPDVLAYLRHKLGEGAEAWMERHFLLASSDENDILSA